jgi:integrase
MPTLKLIQGAIAKLQPPAEGRVEYWDSLLPGFGIRIAAALQPGRDPLKTWQVMYRVNGRQVREKLGTIRSVPKVEQARDLARARIQKAREGIDPVEERRHEQEAETQRAKREERRQRETLSAAIDRYLIECRGRWRKSKMPMRPKYFAETRRSLEVDVKPILGDRPIREIIRVDVRALLDGIVEKSSPSQANHVLAYLRAMLTWAVSDQLIDTSPADKLETPAPAVERDRVLDDDEIRLFWHACETIGWSFGPLLQLLLLTATRRGEIAEATRNEFDLAAGIWTLPRERVKNDKEIVTALSPLAREIIGGLPEIGDKGLLFTTTGQTPVSGFGRPMAKLAAAMLAQRQAELIADGNAKEAADAALEHFIIHDLRRSAASGMAKLGIAPHVVDRILNHTSGTIRGVARIYNRHAYGDERKAALEAWSGHVESLVRPVPSNVVPLAARLAERPA